MRRHVRSCRIPRVYQPGWWLLRAAAVGDWATSAAGLPRTCGPARSSGRAPCRPARRYRSRRCRASAAGQWAVAASMSRAMSPSPYTPAVKMGTGQEGQGAGHLLLADPGDLLKAGADPVCQQFVKRHALDRKARPSQPAPTGTRGAPGCRAVAALSAAGRSHRPVIILNLTRALVTEGNHSPHRERAPSRRSDRAWLRAGHRRPRYRMSGSAPPPAVSISLSGRPHSHRSGARTPPLG